MAASSSTSEQGDKPIAPANSLSPLMMFAAKTIIVVSVCTTALIVSSSYLSSNVLQIIDRASERLKEASGGFSIGGSPFWTKLENELDRIADPQSGLSPEKQEKLLIKLRAASNKWKPFLAEVYAIVTEPPPAKPPAKAP